MHADVGYAHPVLVNPAVRADRGYSWRHSGSDLEDHDVGQRGSAPAWQSQLAGCHRLPDIHPTSTSSGRVDD